MKIELIENTEFGFYNIKFSSRPDYEHNADMLNELKANGWAWSRHNGVWYPRTNEAKSKANNFATEFAKKYNESEKSFGQELFERTQRIDEWKKEHLPQEQNNEPLQEESKPVELNNNQKKVYELLKATNNFSESQILEMVSKIDTAYQTENFNIPELSWEEIKSFIHADDSFDLAKDLRDLYNPNISDTYNKINIVYNYLHDYVDFDVLRENQYESSADAEYHTMRESLRHDILYPVCENIVMGRYKKIEDFQNDFISRREEKIVDISKSYMENPAIKERYIGMKRAELIEKAPEMLKGREFNSWIFNIDNDGHFLFYESNGYLKSEYLNDDKYNSVKDFLSQVEELDLLEESSKQLKEEYTKMHSLLEKPPVQIQDELIAKEVEEELANADERIDTSVSEYNDLGIDTRTGEPWNGEESEDVSEPETQEEESTELTQADLDNATKVIPEEQYQFMLENAAGEEAEYFKKKLKNMATICTDSQKHSNKENVNKDGSHPCKLHYFLGNCDWYISELDNDGIGFGYCILNGDLYNSEWGSVNVCGDSTYEQPLTKMSINVPIRINGSEFHRSVSPELDLHLDEDTTIERELYKLNNEYFADYKKYAEKNEKILAKSSEVSINIIEETNQELEVENGSKTDIGYERRTGISSGSNPNQGLEERGAYSDRGSDTGRGQRILHSEREENGSLENSEGISELHTVGRESEISDLHIEEIQSGNNEILHSERSIETGNSDLQQTGMENGQIPHRVRTIEPEHGTGVNPNEKTSSEPLHGNEEVIEKEADELFKKITEQYDTQYKDFYDTYNKMKESYTENESRYVSDARIGDMFRQVHRELVNLQMNELTDLIKQAPNADIARINATRYFNFCGQDEFSYLHDNLYLRCHLGDYTKDNGRRFVAPTGEELQNFIEETYNSLHGIVAEKETPVYNINGTEYTQETIETLITEDIQNVLNTLSHVPVIEGVRLYQNPEQTGAINILLQYSSKNNDVKWSEDSLFNVLSQEELTFNGMPVDVNPITLEKSGTIEQYLEHFESLGVTNENEAIVKQAEMLDEQFDFTKLADDICQQSYEQSGSGFNYYIDFDEIARLAGKNESWVKENIEKIGEALEEHNDELLLDFNLKEALEEDSLDLNFCSVGEDANELFKKDDSGRWVRKTDRELAIEQGEEEPYDPEIKVKPYDFFINDVANLDLGIGAEIDPITRLSAEKAALKYAELKDKGLSPYIGINIPGDYIFDDKEGQGAGIFTETNGHPSFYMGDNFVKDLKKNDEHAKTVISAYKELYAMTDKYILGVQRPDFVFEKENELFGNQETHTLTNGTQSFEMSFSNKDVEALKERYAEAKEDIKQNYVLEKLSAAGIEVVTDKEEFDKILESHNILQKMKTSSIEEKNPLFQADEKELKAFAQKVDDWKAGKLASTEFISEFSTSTVLQAINIPANKVSITQDVLHKINELETVKVGKSYGHDIDIATIKKIPEFLADPVMVFSSSSTPDSYVIMSENVDKKNRTIMVAMEINKKDRSLIVNNITSAYGRNDNNFFIEQIKLGNLLYQNKQKSLEWTSERGLLLPSRLTTQGSLNVIQKEDIVNKKTSNFSLNERYFAFTENQQEFLKKCGFVNSVGEDNTILDWKMEKKNPFTNKTVYVEHEVIRNGEYTVIPSYICYEDNKKTYIRHQYSKKQFYSKPEEQTFEKFLVGISFEDRENNFIVPSEKLGAIISEFEKNNISQVLLWSGTGEERTKFINVIDEASFKNKVSNLPAKYIAEDIYSSGIQPIGKVLQFVIHDTVAKAAGLQIPKQKHYLLEIQTDNNYEYIHNKDYPRLYEAKWDRNSQSYIDVVELDLSNFDSKIIGRIQYIAVNNCNYPNPPAQTMTLSDGKTYGFAYEGKIYLNPEIMNSEVAVHEYTHLWDNYIQRTNPKLWEKGKDIFQNTKFWEDVKADPNYANISDNDDLLLSEVHAKICGKMADVILNKIIERDGELTKDTVINWENEVDDYIYETFESERTLDDGRTIKAKGYGAFGTVVDINAIRTWFAQPMKDLMNGIQITKNITKENEIEAEYKIMQEISMGLTPDEIKLNLDKYKKSLAYAQEKSKESWEDYYARNTTGFDTPQTVEDFRSAYEHNKQQFEYDVNKYTGWIKALEEIQPVTSSPKLTEAQKNEISKKDIKAIREQCREILQKPDSEITEADKLILAQYEGAGGIKEDNRTVSGILNEFYTPNNLVEKVWQIVDAYAPNAKTVLEPSAGVGKFANNRPNNEFTMHELDETSARINKILHPDANVIQGAYQKQFFDAGERIHTPGQKVKYDVVIGNPPYGTYNDKYKGLGEGKEFDRYEEYFISKGLDALKDENSVMVFVVPSGFLNTASDKQKEIIAAKGRLIDAYRLPVGTFPTTEVGTDIIIMRTWEKDRKIIMENGKGNAAYKQASLDEAIELISDNISNGEWFKQHPEKILGEVKQKTNRFGKLEDVVVVHEGLTVQDELNKIDNFVEGINNSRKLRTYSVLNKDKINELTEVTQEEFNSIIDALYNQPSPDYKSIPSIIKLPQINQTLAQKLGVENANFFMRSEIAHVRPQRKGNYDQALRIDEMKGMLNFLKSCQTAYIDNDERHQNFILAGLDSQNSNKTNKIVFNKDENGNYIVTIGKVDSVEFNGGKYSRVAVGFEPTILRSKLEVWSPIATMLRSSTTPLDSTIPQQTEKSSQIIAPAPVQPEQTQSVSDQSETVAEELDDPTKRLYEDPDGVFKTKHQLTREEFAKFYTGANFTQEDYNIWGATDWKGNVDTSKLTESELTYLKTRDNYVETNEGVYTNAMLYATGNIYQKLDELEENKENLSSESYEKAEAILTNAIPKVVPIENIKIDALSPLAQEFKVHREVTSSRWYMGRTELQTVELDIDLREDFINWATNCSSLDNFDENNQSINSRRSIYNYSSAKISREDIPEDISWTDIVNYIDRVPVPTHIDEKNDTKEVKNKKNLIAGNIKDARKNTCYELFNRYIQEGLPQEDKERLQNTWNKIYNATVHADYKKLPLFIDGMSTFKNNQPFMLYKQQVEGVSRLLSKGNGLLAYEVGVGKTAAGIVTTMGQLQTGRCKRPLIIVPNQVYKKWVNDFRELFPDVKINELYNLSEKYIDKHFDERTHSLLIEPGSVTVITDSALQKITFSDAVCSKELAEDFSYLLGVSDALHSGDDKEKAKAYQKIQNEIGKASRVQVKKLPEGREQRIQQSYIFFDECGFDNVVIDEAHRYKNLFTIPRPKRGDKGAREFEGLGTGKPSIRAEKVFGITTLIQRRNEDRNVFLLTATPFTNNPLEVYSMLSYMGRKELINRHIYDVRDFCTEFAQTKFEYSVKPTGDIEPKQVMKNFRGQKKLKNLVFEYIDAVSAKEAGIERPEGERHPIYLELSTLQQRIIKLEQDAIAASDDPSVTLKAMTTMRTCTLSPALLEPDDFASVEDIVIPPKSQIVESSPKLSWVCNTVADLYKQKPECGQFIYMPQGKDCFDEVKKYLIKQGIPDDAIDYIHSTHNGSAEDKDKISARFNNKEDKLKILIGTATVAEGIDLNGNSIVEYNTMLGWNPTESIQVEGRIWRQGNEQGKVHIMYPLMENSIDALIYQKHDEKASRINSVLSKTDDGKDAIDTDEINPETIKFELITDPTKKVKMIIDEKTAEKRKEIKVIDNRLETIQELEEDRQNSKTLYDTNVEEKEKYKSLLKTAREELKADPNNWQKEARVTSNERAVDTCNKEIAKARNRLNAISYNFNKFDIHEPEREVPIKLQELVTKKAELEADITDIENSKDRLIAEEQKKLLEKKILSKPVEELRKEWVEYVNKNTWYKKQNDKSKDRKETVQVPLEAVKDFKVPDEMIKKFDKAMAEMDFKVLHNYLNWGDRDIINDCHENDKAIVIFRERYEKTKGVKLPEQFRKTTEYLVSVCDGKTLPEVCKFKSMKEAVAYACSSWHGEAYQRDGYVEYVTLDNFKKNRDVSALAKDLQNREGQSYYGYGSPNGFGYDCSPKGVKIEAFINKKREEFFVNWNQVAKIKAKQWNREYPAEFTIKDEPKREGEEKLKNIQMVQQDLFDFDEVKVQTKTLDIRMQGYNSQFILSDQALENYRGLPPFIKKSDNEWVIRCKGEDFAKL